MQIWTKIQYNLTEDLESINSLRYLIPPKSKDGLCLEHLGSLCVWLVGALGFSHVWGAGVGVQPLCA